jgi:hypothetical protein
MREDKGKVGREQERGLVCQNISGQWCKQTSQCIAVMNYHHVLCVNSVHLVIIFQFELIKCINSLSIHLIAHKTQPLPLSFSVELMRSGSRTEPSFKSCKTVSHSQRERNVSARSEPFLLLRPCRSPPLLQQPARPVRESVFRNVFCRWVVASLE